MRSSVLFTAAFAAAVLAKPIVDKREDVVTDVDIVYVTNIVTVTDSDLPVAAATVPVPSTPAAYSSTRKHRGHGGRRGRKTGAYGAAPAPSNPAPAPSAAAPAPAPAPTSYAAPEPQPTTEAPAPAPSSYQQPEPAPSSYNQPAPAPSSTQAAAPPAYTPPSSGTATTYQQAVVMHHNFHRANHSSPDIKWSQSLADTALKIAQTCTYQHNTQMDGGGYGQNIAAGQNASYISSIISDQFYNGEIAAYAGQYGQNPDMSTFESWGHLSQIVWAGTTEVGCATWYCTGGLALTSGPIPPAFTVCNYKEAGNMDGAYAQNVGACKDLPTVTGKDYIDQAAIQSSYESTVQNPGQGSAQGY